MLFKTGKKFKVRLGIPEDAQFRGYSIDHCTNTLMVCVEHQSFNLVAEGMDLPLANPIEIVCEQ